MRWSYPHADAVIAVSQGVADDLARAISIPRQHIDVVYNPVVTARLEERAGVAVEHPWFGDGKPPVILAAGRLTPAKDYPTLLRAFAKVRNKHDCRLIVLGEGELRSVLEALVDELGIGDSVQFPGFSDNPSAWMRKASLFVLSSAWEGLPSVLIEAMACGTQVVSTDCHSGPHEILEGGRWGRLVLVGDSDALASAIGAELRVPGSRNVRERAAHFNVENALDGYLTIIRSEGMQ
jgi:glycosyltransferase involved in cell wall biosynthesis